MRKFNIKWLFVTLLFFASYLNKVSAQNGNWGLLGSSIINNSVISPAVPSTSSSGITTTTANQYQQSDGFSNSGVGFNIVNMQLFKTGSSTPVTTIPFFVVNGNQEDMMSGDMQIIQKGNSNSFYVIYTAGDFRADLVYIVVTVDNSGNPSITQNPTLITYFAGAYPWEIAFTDSKPFNSNGDRYLFVVGGMSTDNARGVYRYTVTSSGISGQTRIQSAQTSGLDNDQFQSACLRLSPDQHFLVWQCHRDPPAISSFWVLPLINYDSYVDYNSNWGTVADNITGFGGGIFGGAIFSPDSRMLYYVDGNGLKYDSISNADTTNFLITRGLLSTTNSVKYRKSGLALGATGELFAIDYTTYTLSYFDVAGGTNTEVTSTIPVRSNGTFSDGGTTGYARLPQEVLLNQNSSDLISITNVDINTRCDPGSIVTSAGTPAVPTFTITTAGGSGTCSYNWYALPGNTAVLNDYHSQNPVITGENTTSGQFIAYFYVTVTDNNGNAAGRVVKLPLLTSNFDLASRDSYFDMYDEPNSQSKVDPNQWHIWNSPDIWNRHQPNGTLAGNNVNEPAVYFDTFGVESSNYLYVNIRNVGCADFIPNGAALHTYWTIGALDQETWDADWKSALYTFNCSGVPQPVQHLGQELSPVNIPAIPVGGSQILETDWLPPNPESYYCSSAGVTDVELCFLARIVDMHNVTGPNACPPDGMSECELTTGSISKNVSNNNNIVTLNTSVAFVTTYPPTIVIGGGNRWPFGAAFSLQFANSYSLAPGTGTSTLSKFANIKVYLGDLYDLWTAGGKLGTYSAIDPEEKSVTFDGTNSVRLDNITMPANSFYPINIQFQLRSGADGSKVPTEMVNFRQLYFSDSTTGTPDTVVGNYSFITQKQADSTGRRYSNSSVLANQQVKVYPNPANTNVYFEFPLSAKVTLKLLDVNGSIVSQQEVYNTTTANFNVNNYASGMYFYQVISNNKMVSGKILISK